MKDETTIVTIFFTILIIIMIVFLFVIYGGYPRGVYWKIEDLREEIRQIEKLSSQTETIRIQLGQLEWLIK